tara:strand:+ start:2278 stop:3072 length:795 start_codon:yes stop_codon:yes gene_type:complete
MKRLSILAAAAALAACNPGPAEAQTPYIQAPATYGLCDWSVIGPSALDLLYQQASIESLYQTCEPAVRQPFEANGITLTDDHYRAIFATVASYSARPYGNLTGLDVADMYHSAVMDCDNYQFLAWHFYVSLGGTNETVMASWINGRIGGTHGQNELRHPDWPNAPAFQHLMLDPNLGMVSVSSFEDAVFANASDLIVDFSWRNDPQLDWLRAGVVQIFEDGQPWPGFYSYARAELAYLNSTVFWFCLFPTPGQTELTGCNPDWR